MQKHENKKYFASTVSSPGRHWHRFKQKGMVIRFMAGLLPIYFNSIEKDYV